MSIDALLSRLDRVRKLGPDRWTACCPAHDDRHPSLAIRETTDGTVLLRCFAGCSVGEIVGAIGLALGDLFPASFVPRHHHARERRLVYRDEVFELLRHEAGVLWLIGCDIHAGRTISDADHARLCEALARIERIAEAAYGC